MNPDWSLGSPNSSRILRETLYLKLGTLRGGGLRMEARILLVEVMISDFGGSIGNSLELSNMVN